VCTPSSWDVELVLRVGANVVESTPAVDAVGGFVASLLAALGARWLIGARLLGLN